MDSKIFDEFSKLQDEVNRFMDHLQNLSKIPAGFSTTPWIPQVNIYETKEQYIILAEIPGVDPEKMKVSVHEKTLTLEGEKKPSASAAESRCKHMEISFGPFSRSIQLDEPVDTEGVQANYHHGYLEIIIPKKRPESEFREIPIYSEE
jgi:HSP20 family protein